MYLIQLPVFYGHVSWPRLGRLRHIDTKFLWMNPYIFSFWSPMNYGISVTVLERSETSKLAVAYAEDLINVNESRLIGFLS